MKFCETKDMKKINSEDWKVKSKKYLKEIQAFLDKADNIENEELKKDIIIQMLKCDKELTLLAEKMFKEYYDEGKNSKEITK